MADGSCCGFGVGARRCDLAVGRAASMDRRGVPLCRRGADREADTNANEHQDELDPVHERSKNLHGAPRLLLCRWRRRW